MTDEAQAQHDAQYADEQETRHRQQGLAQFVAGNGYFAGSFMPDGRVAFLIPRLLDQCDIGIGAAPTQMAGLSELYSYTSCDVAIAMWAMWLTNDFAGEPDCWVRHRPSNRRRRNGDPTQEYVAP